MRLVELISVTREPFARCSSRRWSGRPHAFTRTERQTRGFCYPRMFRTMFVYPEAAAKWLRFRYARGFHGQPRESPPRVTQPRPRQPRREKERTHDRMDGSHIHRGVVAI